MQEIPVCFYEPQGVRQALWGHNWGTPQTHEIQS